MPAENKHIRLSRQIEIYKILESNLLKLDSGAYEYQNGYTDETIAIRFDVHPTAISRLRKQLFGKLARGAAAVGAAVARANRSRAAQNNARMDTLEDRLTALEAQFAAAFGLRLSAADAFSMQPRMQKPISVPVRTATAQLIG